MPYSENVWESCARYITAIQIDDTHTNTMYSAIRAYLGAYLHVCLSGYFQCSPSASVLDRKAVQE